jgi:hypothetical protein
VAYPVKNPSLEIVALRQEPLVVIRSIRRRAEHHRLRAGHPDAQGAGQNFEGSWRRGEAVMEFDNVDAAKRAVEIDVASAMGNSPNRRSGISYATLRLIKHTISVT